MTQQQIEYACKDVVFHFNKAHLQDETIPMWVLKSHGETFYVNHVECNVPWSTKETPDNPSTKGSIKVKNVLLTIDPDNNANLTKLTVFDKVRLRNQKMGITRIMFLPHSDLHKDLLENKLKHGPMKRITAPCTTAYIVCDLLDKAEATFATLKYDSFRVLQPNDSYYQRYDENKDYISPDYSDKDTPYEYS